jgi:sirohydrochlorin ferrochelatase
MELARLDRAAEMLSALAAEIQAEAESRPMRVIFMKAEPASASLLISGIMSIIALQIYGARAMI